jgi:NADH dehydrogenase
MAVPEQTVDVLVLGGGFAAVACARRLEKLLPRDRTCTLVSDTNYFVFQPLLPEVVGASLDPSHVISPVRQMLKRTKVVLGTVEAIELAPAGAGVAGSVCVRSESVDRTTTIRARHLVLALGSVVDVSRIPGMAEQSFLMKNVADALALRHAIIARLEAAVVEPEAAARRALLTFVVVGGGFSGVETAAEVNDLLKSARRFFPTLRGEAMRVVCVHSKERILPELDERLGTYALRRLQARGVEFRLGQRTRAVSVEGVHLAGGELIPSRTVVCTVGNAPHPMLRSLGGDGTGGLPADEFLHLRGRTDVWTFGDCAQVPDGHGGSSPPTAQFATRQGDVAARNIAATFAGRRLMPFRHRSLGQLATLGHLNAVASLGRLRISGFPAWWLWRTIYLLKLPRFDRKLRVVIDWTLNLFFPRDLNALDVARTRGHTTVHLEAGETLFRQGDPSSAFYVVESGAVELTRRGDDGAVLGCDELGPGDHFGEGSLLRSGVRSTTAVAVRPTTVLVFAAAGFTKLTRCFRGLRTMLERSSRRFQPRSGVIPPWVPAATLRLTTREVMTSPVFTLPATATLQQCLAEQLARRFNAFPLVDGAGRLAGLVTSTDLFAALRADAGLLQPLSSFATTRVRCLRPGDPIERAIEIMRRFDTQHAVVVDDGQRVVGMLSMKDVLRVILAGAPALASG